MKLELLPENAPGKAATGTATKKPKQKKWKAKRVFSEQESDALVQAASVGLKEENMARLLGLDYREFQHYLHRDNSDLVKTMQQAREQALAGIASSALRLALDGDRGMIIFLCKTRLGWRENNRLEITGKDGGPVKAESVAITKDFSIEQAMDAYSKLRGGGADSAIDVKPTDLLEAPGKKKPG